MEEIKKFLKLEEDLIKELVWDSSFSAFWDLISQLKAEKFTTHKITPQGLWEALRILIDEEIKALYKKYPKLLTLDPWILKEFSTQVHSAAYCTQIFYLAEKIAKGHKLIPFKLTKEPRKFLELFKENFDQLTNQIASLPKEKQSILVYLKVTHLIQFLKKFPNEKIPIWLIKIAEDFFHNVVGWSYMLSLLAEKNKKENKLLAFLTRKIF